MSHTTSYTHVNGPLGRILLAWNEHGLTRVNFQDGSETFEPPSSWCHTEDDGLTVVDQFRAYFAGSLTTAFLIRGPGFSVSEVGAINKGLGLIATIIGALFGGGTRPSIDAHPEVFLR